MSTPPIDPMAIRGRLRARPQRTSDRGVLHGLQHLGLAGGRDGLFYVSARYEPSRPAPLVVVFHGGGGDGVEGIELLREAADAGGALLVAPDSRAGTWDAIRGRFGVDVAFVDLALHAVFERFAVDETRVGIAGFSDGASYALSLGIGNGDLFRSVLAFSPGFAVPTGAVGTPRVFVSHGRKDRVLPVELCSRKLVPRLRSAGYDVTYREFDGAHAVPPEIAGDAMRWFLGTSTP